MGLLGLGSTKEVQPRVLPAAFVELSAAVDAITSPRRVTKATLAAGMRGAPYI